MSCAAARKPPKTEYLEWPAQPVNRIPIAPKEDMPSKKNKLKFTSNSPKSFETGIKNQPKKADKRTKHGAA